MSIVIKKNIKENAELKTLCDYALILEHINGYTKEESRETAKESKDEPLYKALLERNVELFTTGNIIFQ